MGKRVRDFRYEDDPRMAPIRRYLWKEVLRDTKEGLPEDVSYWLWADHILLLAERGHSERIEQLQVAKGRKQEEARRYRNALSNIVAKTGSHAVAHRIALEALAAVAEDYDHD
ncbi:hypothetical protein [Asaia sp. VD9]|uniref:hypothetical protein n=1 Tax=Asaia sp. VD9 TaxID=3081235 RepID=UPI00301AE210